MLYEIIHAEGGAPSVSPADITMIVCVRAHANNPWVFERLAIMAEHYEPRPPIIVVDFGSDARFASRLSDQCAALSVRYVRSNDDGVFSLASARNIGARAADTPLLFFSDVDCLGEAQLFARLADHANAREMGGVFDAIAVLPVYHLAERTSVAITTSNELAKRRDLLARAFVQASVSPPGDVAEYVDPHSNFFLIRRDFYDFVGGMNERFRGHGSEDFEFMVRLCLLSAQAPLPRKLLDDLGARARRAEPRDDFTGFRALIELLAQSAELAGLRIAHLYHPRSGDGSGWYEERDVRRSRFHAETEPLLTDRAALLEYDWMPRGQRALALVDHAQHTDLLITLRVAGYALTRADGSPTGLVNARTLIESGKLDAVAIFNPYMRSHAHFLPLVQLARSRGIRVIVVERGALPDSWYFASDLSYGDADYAAPLPAFSTYRAMERSHVQTYLTRLATGASTLEANGPVEETRARFAEARSRYRHAVFVPLQLRHDTAVTQFNQGFMPYSELESELRDVASRFPETLFVVKPHPLERAPLEVRGPNVYVARNAENVHALIAGCDAVITYNSGVGLLAILQGQRVVTLGNAFYRRPELCECAESLSQAVDRVTRAPEFRPVHDSVLAFAAFLLHRKYAFIRGESVVRELTSAATHEYRNLQWYRLPFGPTHTVRRAAIEARIDARSYAGMRVDAVERDETRAYGYAPFAAPRRTGTVRSKLGKLSRDPYRFLADSRVPLLRWVSRLVPRHVVSETR